MKVEKSVELESYNWTNLRIKVWQSIDLDQSNTSIKTSWTSLATNVQNLLQRKSILWFINQEHMTNVTFLARCVRKTSLGKTSTETTWESTTRRRKLPKNPHMFILPLRNTIQMVPNQTCQDSRHMTKKRFMGHPSSALNVENHFLPKGIWQNTWKFTSLYFHLICLVILLWLATY